MKKNKLIHVIVFLVFFIFIPNLYTSAESKDDVVIRVNSEKQVYTSSFNVDVTLDFNNLDLYSKKVFLSYHLYDKENKEILWEGKRVPFSVNGDGIGKVKMNIQLVDLKGIAIDSSYVRLKFDLINEQKEYWFSTNKEIIFSTDEIIYEDNIIKKIVGTLTSAIKRSPFIFSVNIIFTIIFIVAMYKFKKSQLFIN